MESRRDFTKRVISFGAILEAGISIAQAGQQDFRRFEPKFDKLKMSDENHSSELLQKRDYRSQPFRVAVAVGDSIVAGGEATSPALDWVSLLASLINESQLEPVKMYNHGIGATVISPRTPTYYDSEKPSLMEGYRDLVISWHPDLVLIMNVTNDARGGTPLGQFLEDERHIVTDIKNQTGAIIVVVSAPYMTAFARYAPFNRANVATLLGFNCALKKMAEECEALYADVFAAEGMAPWMVDPKDGVHQNNLGHRIIANRIFEVLAQNCSCLSQKAMELRGKMKEWRPKPELEVQREFFEKRKKEGAKRRN